jgi:hypothetical protein
LLFHFERFDPYLLLTPSYLSFASPDEANGEFKQPIKPSTYDAAQNSGLSDVSLSQQSPRSGWNIGAKLGSILKDLSLVSPHKISSVLLISDDPPKPQMMLSRKGMHSEIRLAPGTYIH